MKLGIIETSRIYASSGGGGTIPAATGGTITYDGDFKIHTFTSSGTLTVTSPGDVSALVVSGGGGGGGAYARNTNAFGGGGAGGGSEVLEDTITVSSTNYTITVGSGGAGGASLSWGVDGGASSFSTMSASGGKRAQYAYADGASVTVIKNGGASGSGNNGGFTAQDDFAGSGGGGGQGSAAFSVTPGDGVTSTINNTVYGTGGVGALVADGTSSSGGTANKGCGGRGAGAAATSSTAVQITGESGGDGIVVIKYKYQ